MATAQAYHYLADTLRQGLGGLRQRELDQRQADLADAQLKFQLGQAEKQDALANAKALRDKQIFEAQMPGFELKRQQDEAAVARAGQDATLGSIFPSRTGLLHALSNDGHMVKRTEEILGAKLVTDAADKNRGFFVRENGKRVKVADVDQAMPQLAAMVNDNTDLYKLAETRKAEIQAAMQGGKMSDEQLADAQQKLDNINRALTDKNLQRSILSARRDMLAGRPTADAKAMVERIDKQIEALDKEDRADKRQSRADAAAMARTKYATDARGSGEKTPAIVSEAQFVYNQIVGQPENRRLTKEQVMLKAYKYATAKAGMTKEQFIQQFVVQNAAMMGGDKAYSDAQAIASQIFPESEVQDAPWGRRSDGSPKGTGFLGVLRRPDGNVSSELSIGVKMDGKEVEIPMLVPTLTKDEVEYLLQGGEPTKPLVEKAVAHAKLRMSQGKSPFADNSESPQQQGGASGGIGKSQQGWKSWDR